MSELIVTQKLNKTYGKGDSAVVAVNDIDLSIKKGQFTAIVGTSGSGKSTLMHLLEAVDTEKKEDRIHLPGIQPDPDTDGRGKYSYAGAFGRQQG